MPPEDMEGQKEIMVNESKKIMEYINSMSLVNLDDQQVYSLMMIKEIARGVVRNRVEKVTASDVKKALSYSIDKMVGSCKAVNKILSKIDSEGIDDPHSHSVLRMKEIVSSIVTKRDKVDGVNAETVVSKASGTMTSTKKDIDVGDIQRRLFTNEGVEMEAQMRNEHDQNEEQNSIMNGPSNSGNGDFHVDGEADMVNKHGQNEKQKNIMDEPLNFGNDDFQVVGEADMLHKHGQNEEQSNIMDGSSNLGNEVLQVGGEADVVHQNAQNEEQNNIIDGSSNLGNKDLQVGGEVYVVHKHGQNEEGNNFMDGPPQSGNGDIHVGEEQGVMLVDGVTATYNDVQIVQPEGMMFEDVQLAVEDEIRTKEGQTVMQETLDGSSELRNEDDQNEGRKSTSLSPLQLSLLWPPDGKITLEWVKNMMTTFELSSKKDPPSNFRSLVPTSVVDKLFNAASSILSKEPNCVEVDCYEEGSRVVVVGDIHGQFHDLLNLFYLAGMPSENQFYVFNGDYVDRGAWGLEVFMVLLAWKVLLPKRVYLLRGNHETGFCTSIYGFEQEVNTKFGKQGEMVYKKCLECFKELPLASIISSCVYTSHGGLFRKTRIGPLRRSKRNKKQKLELGSLEDLYKVNRFLIDVPDEDPSALVDVLWSDPSKEYGLTENADRGMGLSWGPDCTEAFLKKSKLKLIIRSHEGPDARDGQDDFGDMLSGYTIDHVEESGKLYTLFSAPNYPQFGEINYKNEGAYAVLTPPNLESPSFHSFKAIERPKIDPYVAADVEDVSYASEQDLTSMSTPESSRQINFPAWISSRVDFEALGISNPPSWSILLADDAGGTKFLQVPRASGAPVIEGLPLPSDMQEPHKAAFEYLFELIAALKHMVSTRAIENGVQESAEVWKHSKRKRRAKKMR